LTRPTKGKKSVLLSKGEEGDDAQPLKASRGREHAQSDWEGRSVVPEGKVVLLFSSLSHTKGDASNGVGKGKKLKISPASGTGRRGREENL